MLLQEGTPHILVGCVHKVDEPEPEPELPAYAKDGSFVVDINWVEVSNENAEGIMVPQSQHLCSAGNQQACVSNAGG